MMAKSKSLGRGLGELLGEINEVYDSEVPKNESIVEIPLSQIRPNPHQPRKTFDEKALSELAGSIKEHGLIQPIVLVEDGVDGYLIVAGERRWRASKLAKLKTVRAVIADLDDAQMRQHAIIENIQREDLNVIELAQAYEELIDMHGLTQEELAAVVHKSRTHITNTLRLLQLSKKTRQALIDEKISAGHAKMLVGLSDKEQKIMVDSIHGQKLSVRETEAMVKSMKSRKEGTATEKPRPSNQPSEVLETLARRFEALGFACRAGSDSLTLKIGDDAAAERLRQLLD